MMGLVRKMGLWLSGRRSARRTFMSIVDRHIVDRRLLLMAPLLAVLVCAAAPVSAQSVSAPERDALVKLRTDRGGRAEDVDALVRLANEAAAKGLPAAPLTNKIREGLAKGIDPSRIAPVVRQMASQLETADRLLGEMDSAAAGAGREASVTLLAEAIGSGVTAEEVRDLRRVAPRPGKPPLSGDGLASAAKGLSSIKEAQLSVVEGTAVIAEAVRQGFGSHEILDLGREVKRREADYRAGRASLRALRDAIARGDRPDQLFRDSRPATVERPAPARPAPPAERPTRPDVPPRVDPPVRPDRPATGRDP